MKATSLFFLALCLSYMAMSQAFLFGDNFMYMLMLYPQLLQSLTGGGNSGLPLFMMASGSDNMKQLGTGMMLSGMLNSGAGAAGGNAGTQ